MSKTQQFVMVLRESKTNWYGIAAFGGILTVLFILAITSKTA